MIGHFKSEYIVTDRENEKITPLKLMTKSEVMNYFLKLLDLVQKHADILHSGCLESLTLEYQKRCPLTAKINNMISLGIIHITFQSYFSRETYKYTSNMGASEYLL